MMRRQLKRLAHIPPSVLAVAALLLAPAPSNAGSADLTLSGRVTYSVTMDADAPSVANIMMFENFDSFSESGWSYFVEGEGATTNIARDLYNGKQPLSALFLGLTLGLPSDGDSPQLHLVVMMSEAAASLADGGEWSSLFGDASEAALIDALFAPFDGDNHQTIDSFVNGTATEIPGDGAPVSAWFTVGDDFRVVAFSTGQIIGAGTSSYVTVVPGAVPEPASLALAGLGVLGVLAYDLKRRRRAAA